MQTTVPDAGAAARSRGTRRAHSTVREGVGLGICVAIVTWLWVALLDAVSGTPFRTIGVLGGAALFTGIHLALCLAYGIAILGVLHAAMRTPSVVFGMIFFTILFQAAFVMATALLAQLGVGPAAWSRFVVGNAIAAAITCVYIARRHPLRTLFHAAESDLGSG